MTDERQAEPCAHRLGDDVRKEWGQGHKHGAPLSQSRAPSRRRPGYRVVVDNAGVRHRSEGGERMKSRYRARGSCLCIQQAAWRRLLRPSFPSRLWTCDLVVATPIMSRFDISL